MTFSEILKSGKPVLVDFFAVWCGPCKAMKPILEEFKKKKGDAITILKVDIDKNQAVANSYQIQSVPTLILFKDGKILWRQSGVPQLNQLDQIVSKFV